MTNTLAGLSVQTYAQNPCCTAALRGLQRAPRYQSHSDRKLLIYKASLNCFFSRQSRESLDLQGLEALTGKLSTKLSTENVKICKSLTNQGLSVISGCSTEEVLLTGSPQ
ncbi:hypothetical protein [Polaromonas sp. OV174]|uniref:hypothetical protein n=1 Tax=Polaromonas sp. OV174 TaxID=1855300 RepID=UPI0011603BCE|nr:hypothetical protein [Polaromonas sp. OV174]